MKERKRKCGEVSAKMELWKEGGGEEGASLGEGGRILKHSLPKVGAHPVHFAATIPTLSPAKTAAQARVVDCTLG